jgi:hypothetical protein
MWPLISREPRRSRGSDRPSLTRLTSFFRPSLEWLEDRTVPGFLAPVNYAVGQNPVAVVTGDFNGDRQPDLVTLSSSDRTVSVLLNNGAGTFQAARTFSAVPSDTNWSADSIALGDFNGDGTLDLVTANRSSVTWTGWPPDTRVSYGATILLGNGDGAFQPARLAVYLDQIQLTYHVGGNWYETGSDRPSSVAVGDFNGDGKLDLAATSGAYSDSIVSSLDTNVVNVVLGHGDGTFGWGSGTSVSSPGQLAVGDVNNDGLDDLAARDGNLLLSNGDGTFRVSRTAGVYGTGVFADLNGDGKLDLIIDDGSLLLGNGDGTFRQFATGIIGETGAGDFNADGVIDLAAVTGVYLGNGDGTFQRALGYPAGSSLFSVAPGDFNADGLPDIAAANSLSSNAASVLINNGVWPALPPTVAAFRVNGGSAQRSMVTSVNVTFSGQVTLGPNAFVVTPFASGPAAPLTVTTVVVGGGTVATLTFPGTVGGSLADGDWVLLTVASMVRDAAGDVMAADRRDTFFRLYGDVNGDRTVNGSDLAAFRSAFGAAVGDQRYVAVLDYDSDGTINGVDLAQFRTRFGFFLP